MSSSTQPQAASDMKRCLTSHCAVSFAIDVVVDGEPRDDVTKLFVGLINTKLFCMNCNRNYANIINRLAKANKHGNMPPAPSDVVVVDNKTIGLR